MKKDNSKRIQTVAKIGADTVTAILKNKMVICLCFLIQGLYYIFTPAGSLKGDARMLTALLALYAFVTLLMLIAGRKKEHIQGAKDMIDDQYREYLNGKRRMTDKSQELLSEDSILKHHVDDTDQRYQKLKETLSDRQEDIKRLNTVFLIPIYLLILVISVFLFIKIELAVIIVHSVLGILIFADGIFSIITAVKTKELRFYQRVISVIISYFSMILGIALVLTTESTAEMVFRILGVILVIKSLSELWVMFRNRELLKGGKEVVSQLQEGKENIFYKNN